MAGGHHGEGISAVKATAILSLILSGSVIAAELQQRARSAPSEYLENSTISGRGVSEVQLRLARGSVTVTRSRGPDIAVRITQRSTSTDPRLVIARISRTASRVRIVAVHPEPFHDVMHECLQFDDELGDFWHHDVTVDVGLELPAQSALHVRTMRGDVVVSGRTGHVDVATNDGNIRLSDLHADVTAAALGNIDMETVPGSLSGPRLVRLSTYSGDLKLQIPAGERVRTDAGRSIVVTPEMLEVLRTESTVTRRISLGIGERMIPVDAAVSGGRLLLIASPQ